MSCIPGTPCYSSGHTIFPRGCGIDPCHAHKTNTDLTFYSGPNLPCTGVNTCDSLTLALEKIDNAICQLQNCCSTTSTTSTSSTTTTTTTTICPCTIHELYGTIFDTANFTFIDCDTSMVTTITVGDSPYFACIDNRFPVFKDANGIDVNTGECCSTTTTTTTVAPTTTTTTTTIEPTTTTTTTTIL